jgi:hypothetical protein
VWRNIVGWQLRRLHGRLRVLTWWVSFC